MALREVVLKELVRRRVAGALRERAAIDRALPSAAPAQASELLARRAPIEASLEAAMREVASLLPPFEIAMRIEAAVARVLAQLGGALGPGLQPVLTELEAVAERIETIWLPGVDLPALAERLADPNTTRATPSVDASPKEHPQLGWAPIGEEELRARAASTLGGSVATLKGRARREEAERGGAIARLVAARDASGTFASLLGANQEERREVDARSRELAREAIEAAHAYEDLQHAIVRALATVPPIRLALAARAAAAVGPLATDDVAVVIGPRGSFELRNLGGHRALFLAAIADLRHACDEVFPGLAEIAAGSRGALLDLASAERAATLGPYRGDASSSEGASEPEPESTLITLLDGAGAPAVVGRALAHATMLGFLRSCVPREVREPGFGLKRGLRPHDATTPVTVSDRLAFHRHALLPITHALVMGCADARLPRVLLLEALAQVKATLAMLRPMSDGFSSVWVHGHAEAAAAAQRLGFVIGVVLAAPSNLWSLASTVAERARGGPPTGSWLLEALARDLGATDFPELTRSRAHLAGHLRATQAALQRAEEAVPFLDRMNVFFTSDLEAQRDALVDADKATQAELDEASWRASEKLAAASRAYPFMALLGASATLGRSIGLIQAVKQGRNSPPRLVGHDDSLRRLTGLVSMANATLGPLPSAAEVLERYVVARLVARRGFADRP